MNPRGLILAEIHFEAGLLHGLSLPRLKLRHRLLDFIARRTHIDIRVNSNNPLPLSLTKPSPFDLVGKH